MNQILFLDNNEIGNLFIGNINATKNKDSLVLNNI